MGTITYRDLTSLADVAAVVDLERVIWGEGYGDVVPTPILTVTTMRGGILIGAFDGARMIGFVYSFPGLKNGRPMQWSHMLGVVDEYRSAGIGLALKLLQRERALALGLDLIEWTFDPMQAVNAHLNFAKLGAIARDYEVNVYGESKSVLHGGNPTDRLIAEWRIQSPGVLDRAAAMERGADGRSPGDIIKDAEPVNGLSRSGEWPSCAHARLLLDAPKLSVSIPMGFTAMLSRAPELAMEWRLATRQIFTACFARGYVATDFVLNRAENYGTYLLSRV